MKPQMMAMVLSVTSAMSDEAARGPVDPVAKPRQHAVHTHHLSQAQSASTSVCAKILRDRFDEQSISSSDGYFYQFNEN